MSAFVYCYYCWRWSGTYSSISKFLFGKEEKLFTCRFVFGSIFSFWVFDWFGVFVYDRKHRHRFCFVCKPSHSIKINFAQVFIRHEFKEKERNERHTHTPSLYVNLPHSQNHKHSRFGVRKIIQKNWMRFHVCVFPCLFLFLSFVFATCLWLHSWLPATQTKFTTTWGNWKYREYLLMSLAFCFICK